MAGLETYPLKLNIKHNREDRNHQGSMSPSKRNNLPKIQESYRASDDESEDEDINEAGGLDQEI